MSPKNIGIILAIFVLVQLACGFVLQPGEKIDQVATTVAENLQLNQVASTMQLDSMATSVAETVQAGLAQVAPPPLASETATATTQAEVTPTASETPSYSATPEFVTVSVSVDTNCRSGPGTAYPSLGALLEGEIAEVVGKFSAADFWIIDNPDSLDTCWLWGQYATVIGDTSTLKEYKQPPTPIPSKTPTPTKTTSP